MINDNNQFLLEFANWRRQWVRRIATMFAVVPVLIMANTFSYDYAIILEVSLKAFNSEGRKIKFDLQ